MTEQTLSNLDYLLELQESPFATDKMGCSYFVIRKCAEITRQKSSVFRASYNFKVLKKLTLMVIVEFSIRKTERGGKVAEPNVINLTWINQQIYEESVFLAKMMLVIDVCL